MALDEYAGKTKDIAFELEHDLARGLVRQFTAPAKAGSAPMGSSVSEMSGAASGVTETEPPRGGGQWVFLHEFDSFGFGQYQGSDATHHVYCSGKAKVWAWLAGAGGEQSTPDDVANLVIIDEQGMARLKLSCDSAMAVTN
jgi:hypothetical protein